MEYKLQILDLKKFLWIILPSAVLSFVAGFVLFVLLTNNFFLFPLTIPIPILLFRFLQKKLSKTTSFIFNKEGLSIQNITIPYSEIEGYHWDSNITMDALSIKLKNDEVTRYTISKLDKPKTNVNSFYETFNSVMNENPDIIPHLKYSEVHKKEVELMKPTIIFGLIILIGFGVFYAIKGIKPPPAFYFMPGLLIFMYLKVYK